MGGEVLVRCKNVLYIRAAEDDMEADGSGAESSPILEIFCPCLPKNTNLKSNEAERVYKSFFSTLGCNSLSLLFVNLFVVSFAKYKFMVLEKKKKKKKKS